MRAARLAPRPTLVVPLRHTASAAAASAPAQPKKKRISPHVQIFKFPLPALVSITTRFTGIGLSAGVAVTGIGCLLGDPAQLPHLIDGFKVVWAHTRAVQFAHASRSQTGAPVLVPVAKALVAFPFVFHTASGIRHLIWDTTAKGFDLRSVYASSYFIIGVSAVSTLGLAAYCID